MASPSTGYFVIRYKNQNKPCDIYPFSSDKQRKELTAKYSRQSYRIFSKSEFTVAQKWGGALYSNVSASEQVERIDASDSLNPEEKAFYSLRDSIAEIIKDDDEISCVIIRCGGTSAYVSINQKSKNYGIKRNGQWIFGRDINDQPTAISLHHISSVTAGFIRKA